MSSNINVFHPSKDIIFQTKKQGGCHMTTLQNVHSMPLPVPELSQAFRSAGRYILSMNPPPAGGKRS